LVIEVPAARVAQILAVITAVHPLRHGDHDEITFASASGQQAVYLAHPYEEPVVYLLPTVRLPPVRRYDDSNPNRFWGCAAEDWVPLPHCA
jgi:hypothetical protein